MTSRLTTVGLDFGTGSARALVIDVLTGAAIFERVVGYRCGVFDSARPPDFHLPPKWVIQKPGDFLEAAGQLLRAVAVAADEQRWEVSAIGVTATSCTVLPTLVDARPLFEIDEFAEDPHAYVKVWKHHAAFPYAERVSSAGESFLARYNGKTSAEWSLAKSIETMSQSPRLWEAADRWIDIADWIVWQLTGTEARSASIAGCKNHWQPDCGGYPSATSLDNVYDGASSWLTKLADPLPLGTNVGPMTPAWCELTGLRTPPTVSVAIVDAQSAVLGADVRNPGTLTIVAGTSTCHLSLSADPVLVPGVESIVSGGAINGLFDYSTGQPATGDMLEWFTSLLSAHGGASKEETFASLNQLLEASQGPGPVSVIDWWSGNRTPFARSELRGAIFGLSTTTRPEAIYRAMVESAAMGARMSLELHRRANPIRRIRFTGGLAGHGRIMQLYADVFGEPIEVHPCQQGSARGAALWAAESIDVDVPPDEEGAAAYTPAEPGIYDEAYQQYRAIVESHGQEAASAVGA